MNTLSDVTAVSGFGARVAFSGYFFLEVPRNAFRHLFRGRPLLSRINDLMGLKSSLTLILLSVAPILGTHAAEVQVAPRGRIGQDGTVQLPGFDVPLSSYMSEQAQRAFIHAAVAAHSRRPSDTDQLPASVSAARARWESELESYLNRARELYPVNVEQRQIAGVPTRVVTPAGGIAVRNGHRVLIKLHGGGFFQGAGNEALLESIPIAGRGRFKVITVDYRQGPEYRFPAASEDIGHVYCELLREYKPRNIGIYGCSAGGVLTAMAVAWIEKHRQPIPGAIGVFSAGAFGGWYQHPSVPGSWSGDSAYVAPLLAGLLDESRGIAPKPASPSSPADPDYVSAYLAGTDLTDPLVSPALHSSMLEEFPPTLLISGTRAIDMSAAVETQRALPIPCRPQQSVSGRSER
jgi:acetyl esterase/lipase